MSDVTAPLPASRDAELIRDDFLSFYRGGTHGLYETDLRLFFTWCADQGIDPLDARRATLEQYVKHMQVERGNSPRSIERRFGTIRGFYKIAVADEHIRRDPCHMVRLPKWKIDRDSIPWMDRYEMARLFDIAEQTSPAHHALMRTMGTLAYRVSEACSINIEDIAEDASGYTTVTTVRKGGDTTTDAVPVPLLRVFRAAAGDRTSGPLILTRAGNRQTRNGAHFWMKQLCRRAELSPDLRCHSLRHSAITAAVDAGLPIHEVQRFANHRDIRQTEHYYRRHATFDQHGSHAVARFIASAA